MLTTACECDGSSLLGLRIGPIGHSWRLGPGPRTTPAGDCRVVVLPHLASLWPTTKEHPLSHRHRRSTSAPRPEAPRAVESIAGSRSKKSRVSFSFALEAHGGRHGTRDRE